MRYVELANVAKSFEGHPVIHGVSLAVDQGKLLVLVGPSGCGKTTIIRLIAGLEALDSGQISIDGRIVNDVHPRDRDIAMVFQNYALYPDKTVFENMAFGLRMRRTAEGEIARRVSDAAQILGLSDLLHRRPRQLSGGQRQRVAVGRAIVRNPKVFLFDEPLSNLDAHLRVHMRTEIIKLHQRLGATMIYVTHDQIEAMTLGDVIAVMNEGRLMQLGPPLELYRRPRNLFVARFIGSPAMNVVRVRLGDRGGEARLLWGDVDLPVPERLRPALLARASRDVVFGIRSEDIHLAADRASGIPARIEVVEHLGPQTQLSLVVAGATLTALVSANDGLAAKDHVGLTFDLANSHFFDPASEAAIGL